MIENANPIQPPLQKFLDWIMPWREAMEKLRVDNERLRAENALFRSERYTMALQISQLQAGNAVALSFIHKTHHLGANVSLTTPAPPP